jgi:hypothetical protein
MICERKSKQNRELFIGVLICMHRGFGILTNLSLNRLQTAVDKEKSEAGEAQFK